MLIDIFSDPHIDAWANFYRGKYSDFRKLLKDRFIKNEGSNVVIFAGDAGNGWEYYRSVYDFLLTQYEYVISIPGNHDYYFENEVVPSNTQFFTKIEDYTFSGATLWTNFRNDANTADLAQRYINDFQFINPLRFDVYPDQLMEQWNWQDRAFLETAKADVMVTHFSPSSESTSLKFLGDPLNGYFTNECEYLIPKRCKLWVHGHTHDSFDYMIGDTRVVCHPIGYPRENSDSFHINPKQVEI